MFEKTFEQDMQDKPKETNILVDAAALLVGIANDVFPNLGKPADFSTMRCKYFPLGDLVGKHEAYESLQRSLPKFEAIKNLRPEILIQAIGIVGNFPGEMAITHVKDKRREQFNSILTVSNGRWNAFPDKMTRALNFSPIWNTHSHPSLSEADGYVEGYSLVPSRADVRDSFTREEPRHIVNNHGILIETRRTERIIEINDQKVDRIQKSRPNMYYTYSFQTENGETLETVVRDSKDFQIAEWHKRLIDKNSGRSLLLGDKLFSIQTTLCTQLDSDITPRLQRQKSYHLYMPWEIFNSRLDKSAILNGNLSQEIVSQLLAECRQS